MLMDSYCSLTFRVNFAIEVSEVNAFAKTRDKKFGTRFQVDSCKLKHLIDFSQPLR